MTEREFEEHVPAKELSKLSLQEVTHNSVPELPFPQITLNRSTDHDAFDLVTSGQTLNLVS